MPGGGLPGAGTLRPGVRRGAAVLVGGVLVALVALLIWDSHKAAERIRSQVLVQHQQAFRLHAYAVAHLLASADEELRHFAGSSEVAAFHESRDLGMSMQYGLGLALVPIRARLGTLVTGEFPQPEGRFDALALLDADGSRLAVAGSVPLPPRPDEDSLPAVSVEARGDARHVVVSRPVTSKGRPVGWVVGWIRPARLQVALSQDAGSAPSRFIVLDEAGRALEPGRRGAPPDGLAALPADGRFVELAGDGEGPVLAQRLEVPGHALTLVDLDRRADLLGDHTPLANTLALSLGAVAVLAALAIAVRRGTRAAALQARLDESQRRAVEVAEKHAALERADRERQRLWQAVSGSPAVVIIADRTGRIEYVNATFERVTGRAGRDLVGDPRFLLATRGAGGGDLAAIWAALRRGGMWSGEVMNTRADGEPVWLSVSISPARSDEGAITHFIAIGEDVTARTLAARELARARDAAEAANRAKSAFLAGMSHEIRTPLNAILGYTYLTARDPSLSPGARHNLETINRSGEHLLALLNQVLELSRIEAGRAHVDRAPFDLAALLRDLDAMFGLKARGKGLAFELGAAPEPCALRGDAGKIRQVLVNLVGNAVKFTERGRVRVEVELRPEGEGPARRLVVRVADTGPGIAPDELARLFREFEQTSTGKALKSGTGLGLALSRGLARLMGGDLTAASTPGEGAVFSFEVPVEPSAEPLAARPDRRVVGIAGAPRPPRLLVVDDEATNRGWLCGILREVGCEVREVEDGAAALDACAGRWPDLVLMDLRMPGIDGVEATRRIREGGDAVPVVALTASAFEAEQAGFHAAGADAVLAKPVREAALLAAVGRALGLTWRYEEPAALPAAVALTPEAVAALPRPLRERMREATRRGDVDRLAALIDEAAAASDGAARSLRALASRYDYDALDRALAEGGRPT